MDEEEIELSLGLSLNGRFGTDPRAKDDKSLKRCCSISDLALTVDQGGLLGRSLSLPDDLRRRKEIQSLRRSEAKRKRAARLVVRVPNQGSGASSGLSESDSLAAQGGQKCGETTRRVLEDMPSVSTTGIGVGGRRVEGFLYGYGKGNGKGEQVRIVCVCHGSFHSPADFVRHAGGDAPVHHPLKHILVNTTPFL